MHRGSKRLGFKSAVQNRTTARDRRDSAASEEIALRFGVIAQIANEKKKCRGDSAKKQAPSATLSPIKRRVFRAERGVFVTANEPGPLE